jgi:hypothetical protein
MSDQWTPIDRFWDDVMRFDYEAVRKAIADGFDINAQIPGKVPPITRALGDSAAHMEMLKFLWEAGAHPATPLVEQIFADFAAGGDGSKFVRKKVQVGTIKLHRFNGDEEFALEEAYLHIQPETETSMQLELEAGNYGTVLKGLPDTEILNAWPGAHIFVELPFPASEPLTGKKISLPVAYDETIQNTRATFYYVEHEALEDNEIEFLEHKDNRYRIRWTGRTMDVNFYDGSKPDTRIEIEGWFTISESD